MFDVIRKSPNQLAQTSLIKGISLSLKREDLLHPFISGNKWRKLKYNLITAKQQGKTTLITFGGAYSNHISAVAAAGSEYRLNTIGYIRGEELASKIDTNSTLSYADQCGMELRFLDRESYRRKNDPEFLEILLKEESDYYLLPEGGTNDLAIKGCQEILDEKDEIYDYICAAVGTGGTILGIIQSASAHQQVLGFPALKGDFLAEEISKLSDGFENWQLVNDYHFGGYAKVNADLVAFMNTFKVDTEIPLDPVYTGKMVYGIAALANKGFFKPNAKVLAIHTGGLQGVAPMNRRLEKKGMSILI